MAYIRSANQAQFTRLNSPGPAEYEHSADTRRNYIPLAFQVTSPYDETKALLPHALIAHVNPQSFAETFSKRVERIQTRGGFVEQHWGDELAEISVDQSTGAFINMYTGLSSLLRQRTIAWDRYRDLYDLYRNNGSVTDPYGAVVLQGWVMIMYDRGTYIGGFRNFSVEETDESPFTFKMSWTFKVERVIQKVPLSTMSNPPQRQSSANRTGGDSASLSGGITEAQLRSAGVVEANEALLNSAKKQGGTDGGSD